MRRADGQEAKARKQKGRSEEIKHVAKFILFCGDVRGGKGGRSKRKGKKKEKEREKERGRGKEGMKCRRTA